MAIKKTTRYILNAVMVIAAAIIVIAGVMLALGFRSGALSADTSSGASISAVSKTGNVNIERGGIGYTLDEGANLQNGDLIETLDNSSISVLVEGTGEIILDERSLFRVETGDNLRFELLSGTAFCDVNSEALSLTVGTAEGLVSFSDAVLAVSARTGSSAMHVLAGSVTDAVSGDVISSGKTLSFAKNSQGGVSGEVVSLSLVSLDDFVARHAKHCVEKGRSLCFTADEIESMLVSRNDGRTQAQQESSSTEGAVLSTQSGKAASVDSGNEETPGKSDSTGSTQSSGGSPEASQGENSPAILTCTIEIRCDTILNNMDNLAPGKDTYVPRNGTILSVSTIECAQGESVFDVLRAACDSVGLQIEYSYTPLYGSYYIEGINNLYEFDCGEQSGWMYKVNGWFPNYGCSSYNVKDGDTIVWCYTCNGLGADVGGSVY